MTPLINVPLVPVKLLMFLIHGGISALLPFLGIHMKSLGLTVTETSIILTVLPFVSAIGEELMSEKSAGLARVSKTEVHRNCVRITDHGKISVS